MDLERYNDIRLMCPSVTLSTFCRQDPKQQRPPSLRGIHLQMSPAAHQIFTTSELLELILLHLPMRDLLVNAQRVNRLFSETIVSSPTLNDALFFRHKPQSGVGELLFNPLLQQVFPEWLEDPRTDLISSPFSRSDSQSFFASVWNSSDKMRTAFPRKESSWRRMLVVHPPAVTLDLDARLDGQVEFIQKTRRFKFDQGLRMGVLYDLVYAYFARIPVCSFRMLWSPITRESIEDDPLSVGPAWEPKLILAEVMQCDVSASPDIGVEFESQGFEANQVNSILDWMETALNQS